LLLCGRLRLFCSNLAGECHIKSIYISPLELSCKVTTLEEQIDLGERTARRLGKAKVVIRKYTEAGSGPEESGKVAPFPGRGVDYVRCEDNDNNGTKVIHST
jgi:hypothetical protein